MDRWNISRGEWAGVAAVLVAVLVTCCTFLAFGLYSWSAIHSGWSDWGLQIFVVALYVSPPILGLVADG